MKNLQISREQDKKFKTFQEQKIRRKIPINFE